MATFSVEVMVRGYHVYQCVWSPIVGKELPCRKECGNTQDPFAVAMLHGTTTVGLIIPYNSRALFSRLGQNPRKPRNLSSSKIKPYTV